MPGMPGMGMGKRGKAKQAPKKGKSKRGSGNPAKRAQQEKAASEKAPAGQGANPFGLPAGQDGAKPEDFELPAEFSKFLPKQ
jgi:signal recognition particle subunit SRP54